MCENSPKTPTLSVRYSHVEMSVLDTFNNGAAGTI